jgi:hypothetical protein
MPITDPAAIKFSNERVRVSADRLAQAYYKAVQVKTRWDALGGGQAAIDQMPELRTLAATMATLYEWCWRTEKLWFILGGTSLIPNNSEVVYDNGSATGPDPNRPQITGQNCVAVIDRVVQFQNWLLSATGSFADALRNAVSWYNTVLAASSEGPSPLTVADAGNFVTRCSELKTNYEANTNVNLGILLAVAVNPGGG